MTYAQLQEQMSSTEFEMWMALFELRQDECPNCGVEPKDLMDYDIGKAKCPVCKFEYEKLQRARPGEEM